MLTTMTTIYHCPCCNMPMDEIISTFEYPHKTVRIVNVTCWREACDFHSYTMSPEQANNAETLKSVYHIDKLFDVFSGEDYEQD